MYFTDYKQLHQIWNHPEWIDSKKLWLDLKKDYPNVQSACGNCLERCLLDNDEGLKACLMKKDTSFFEMIYLKYGRWKYTQYNHFSRYVKKAINKTNQEKLQVVKRIREYYEHVLNDDFLDEEETKKLISKGLEMNELLSGIGVAGMSGILALLLSEKFGVVDSFVAKALNNVRGDIVKDPKDIKIAEAVNMEWIYLQTARVLNDLEVGTAHWIPRDVDKALWSYRVKTSAEYQLRCKR